MLIAAFADSETTPAIAKFLVAIVIAVDVRICKRKWWETLPFLSHAHTGTLDSPAYEKCSIGRH